MKGIQARLTLRPNSVTKCCCPHNVPYALGPRMEVKLKRLTELGVISPIEHSDCATPVVPVSKKRMAQWDCVRILRVTRNPALYVDKYPIPRIEDLFAWLAPGQQIVCAMWIITSGWHLHSVTCWVLCAIKQVRKKWYEQPQVCQCCSEIVYVKLFAYRPIGSNITRMFWWRQVSVKMWAQLSVPCCLARLSPNCLFLCEQILLRSCLKSKLD